MTHGEFRNSNSGGYQYNGTYLWPAVRGRHHANLAYVLDDLAGWGAAVTAELGARRYRNAWIWIHDSGDFFSVLRGLVSLWCDVASVNGVARSHWFSGGVALWLLLINDEERGYPMRAFAVRMPSGSRYWTVLDDQMDAVPVADRFLRELRFGRDCAESTTKSYASAAAMYLRWCRRTGRDWTTAATDIGLFMTWLKYTPGYGDGGVVSGPGGAAVRSERRINGVLVVVRGFLSFAAAENTAPGWILGQLYELADTRDLPIEA